MTEGKDAFPGLKGMGPEGIGALGSDFVAYMREAAEAYCIQRAVEEVKRGFREGYAADPKAGTPESLH